MPIRQLIFDLDETLYPRGTGIMPAISVRIRRYITEVYGLSPAEADALALHYFHEYGTSMRGLYLNYQLDTERFLRYVHDFPLDTLLDANPALDALLSAIPLPKAIFTNASQMHAVRILDRLGVREHFSQIVDVKAVGFVSKPDLRAYRACVQLLGVSPDTCVLIEDTGRNLPPAAALGMTTVLVDGDPAAPADYRIANILQFPLVLTEICRQRGCASPQAASAWLPQVEV